MRTCAQKVPLVKKWVNYMPRKGVKLEIDNFRILLFWFNSHSSLTAALTNMKLGREIKLCDPTNNVMFKICNNSENKNKQHRAIHYKGGLYVHVTDKENHCGRRNLICG